MRHYNKCYKALSGWRNADIFQQGFLFDLRYFVTQRGNSVKQLACYANNCTVANCATE